MVKPRRPLTSVEMSPIVDYWSRFVWEALSKPWTVKEVHANRRAVLIDTERPEVLTALCGIYKRDGWDVLAIAHGIGEDVDYYLEFKPRKDKGKC